MTEQVEPVAIETLQDFVPHVQLVDVIYGRYGGRTLSPDEVPEDPDGPSLQLGVAGGEDRLQVQLKTLWLTKEAEFDLDIAARFAFDVPLRVAPQVVADFVGQTGILVIYPYLREAVFTLAARLRVDIPILELITPGQIQVHALNSGDPAQGGPEPEGA